MRFPGLLGLAFSLLVVFAVASPAAAQPAGSVVFSASRDGDHELYRVAAAGGSVTRLTRNRSSDSAPAVSPNGRLVAFVSDRDGDEEIFVMRLDRTALWQVTRNRAADHSPGWSPNGRHLVFASDRSGDFELYAAGRYGGDVRRLTRSPGFDVQPAWSPDGRRIAFASTRVGGQFDVYSMRRDGSDVRRLTFEAGTEEEPVADMAPAWSPDGARIAFSSTRGGVIDDLWTMGADGSGLVQVTATAFVDEWTPHFSPDGEWLLFTASSLAGGVRIAVARVDGSERRRLAGGLFASWAP